MHERMHAYASVHVLMHARMHAYAVQEDRNLDWLQYFDLVIVGACKPQFVENERLPLFRVHTEDGLNRFSPCKEWPGGGGGGAAGGRGGGGGLWFVVCS